MKFFLKFLLPIIFFSGTTASAYTFGVRTEVLGIGIFSRSSTFYFDFDPNEQVNFNVLYQTTKATSVFTSGYTYTIETAGTGAEVNYSFHKGEKFTWFAGLRGLSYTATAPSPTSVTRASSTSTGLVLGCVSPRTSRFYFRPELTYMTSPLKSLTTDDGVYSQITGKLTGFAIEFSVGIGF